MKRTNEEIEFDYNLKLCTHCREYKPRNQFYNSNKSPDGKYFRCKKCDKKLRSEYLVRRKEDRKVLSRNQNWKAKYGLTEQDYFNLLTKQNNSCAICGKSVEELTGYIKHLAVDHNHITKEIRGLLCQHCNRGLGFFKEDYKLLLKASKYLECH